MGGDGGFEVIVPLWSREHAFEIALATVGVLLFTFRIIYLVLLSIKGGCNCAQGRCRCAPALSFRNWLAAGVLRKDGRGSL
jgi:hypothetical protein